MSKRSVFYSVLVKLMNAVLSVMLLGSIIFSFISVESEVL